MARYNVKKVDSQGKVIKNFTVWRRSNPEALCFDSKLEYNFYTELKKRKLKFEYQVEYLLQQSFKFTDWTTRKVEGISTTGWFPVRIRPITWTADFLLNDYNIVVEAKGKPNDAFPNKLKMFKHMVVEEQLGLRVIVLHSLKELNEFLDSGLTV